MYSLFNQPGEIILNSLEYYYSLSAFRYAKVIFDGFRVYRKYGKYYACNPKAHINRFLSNASLSGFVYKNDYDGLKNLIADYLNSLSCDDLFIRIFLTSDSTEFSEDSTGKLVISHLENKNKDRKHHNSIGILKFSFRNIYTKQYIKSPANYMICEQIKRQYGIKEKECVLIDHNKIVSECIRSSIMFVKNNHVYAPNYENYMLKGVTRQIVKEVCSLTPSIKFTEKNIYENEIGDFDGAFLASSTLGIQPVHEISKYKYSTQPSMIQEISDRYMKAFKCWIAQS